MSIISELKERVLQYVDVHVKLFKINFIGRSANLFSYFLFSLICLFILFCVFLFIGFGLTEVFINAGMSKMASFFLVIGIYILLLLIVVALRKNITRFFAGGFIRVLTEGDDEEEEEAEK